ncbi:SusD/RagB family nutrient-binding outer membrane lipoprotein [Chitinophaga agrisoli]|uniref:SusD/RagB family nutrient-binding outer membrane lipoprotein n=1 Tax=Chitinophaga agrisoli TaxID=2607653 RepID=A0A5B2VR47_9BACT|nr:SusD/RagB family nutrient-binding outer membrane lipoprotein [Chitinophaga agrisoli]KAA2240619.1 SusD/RagB family nutrient-binding outer membrane lipoprotein [Chitinophaga agrisoli]
MRKIYVVIYLLLFTALAGCKKFEKFQTDPNKPTLASPDLVLTNIEVAAFKEIDIASALASRQMAYTDGVDNSQYYGWQRAGFGDYNNLRQVVQMENEATRVNKPVYMSLGKFFRAFFIMRLTLTFGDVPYSEALKGGSDENFTPAYDKQEDIFLQVLDQLKAANNELDETGASIQGDVIFGGSIKKWKQLINSFSLRVLITLSQKEGNTKLNVKQRFSEILNNPTQYPLFTGNGDNAQLVFYDLQNNRYPYFNNNGLQTAYYMEETFVNMLKGLKDPRLFRMADKAPDHTNQADDDFNAYGGIMGSATINENSTRVAAGEASKIDARYYHDPVNEPSVSMGYAELQFILAEAVVRGWISGSADDFYKKGIQASMEFYKIAPEGITAYLAQPAVQLPKGGELQAIITQKYIGSFLNTGWLSFYEQRRTGFPVFDVSGGGVLNNKQIPKRWMYPENEFDLNRNNVTAAIDRQFPAGDNINGQMWLLIKE